MRRARIEHTLETGNIVMRRGHWLYGLTDPFVQEIWRERRAIDRPLKPAE